MTQAVQKWEDIPQKKLLDLFLSIEDSYQGAVVKKFEAFIKKHGGLTEESLKAYKEHLEERYRNGEIAATTMINYLSMVRSRIKKVADYFNLDDFTHFRLEKALNNVKSDASERDPSINPEKDVLTPEEIRTIVEESTDKMVPYWVTLLYKTGIRITEMLSIRLTDIRYEKDHAMIHIRGKGKKDRDVMISKELLRSLKAVFEGKTWLLEHHGKQYSRTSVTSRIRDQGRYLLQRSISAHNLRHTFATEKLVETKDLPAVSKYLGHSSTKITADIYTHTRLTWDNVK